MEVPSSLQNTRYPSSRVVHSLSSIVYRPGKGATMAASNNGRARLESFEESFRRLQEVVQRLSEGSLTLQEAMAAFEEGMSLADRCATMLDEAELRVKQVSDKALRAGSALIAE